MQICVTGSSGLVGSALVPFLTTGGHKVLAMVRRQAKQGQVSWDPDTGTIDTGPLNGLDAAVHLAGESIASGRWTAEKKARIRSSRVDGTRVLCNALAQLDRPPKVLVSASAIGFYGDRGTESLDEESSSGEGFLASVCREWEDATKAAADVGLRVVNLRFGIVLSPRGGALAKMLTPFRLGLGGRVGNGRQMWSWISIDDAVGAVHQAIVTESLSGPVNVVAPNSVSNTEFTKVLGRVLRRPTLFPAPRTALRAALGEMAKELLLASADVKPRRLIETDYQFQHPTLEGTLRHVLGRG